MKKNQKEAGGANKRCIFAKKLKKNLDLYGIYVVYLGVKEKEQNNEFRH
jgi:hypothetical protein